MRVRIGVLLALSGIGTDKKALVHMEELFVAEFEEAYLRVLEGAVANLEVLVHFLGVVFRFHCVHSIIIDLLIIVFLLSSFGLGLLVRAVSVGVSRLNCLAAETV